MRSKFRTSLIAATTAAAMTLSMAPAAHAAKEPTTGVELNHPLTQTIGHRAMFDYADGEQGFQAMRDLRASMWDKNPPFKLRWIRPGGNRLEDFGPRLQDVARAFGYNTKEKYVNAVKYDHGLSIIAVQRSVEASAKWGHERPYNNTCTLPAKQCADEHSATINGVGAMQNIYRIRGGSQSMRNIVLNNWGGTKEYDSLVRHNGNWYAGGKDDQNGHLFQLLNPVNTYMGFGVAQVDGTGTYAANSLNDKPTGVKSYPRGLQSKTIYRAAMPHERPTGIIKEQPKPAPSNPSPSKPAPNKPAPNKPTPNNPTQPNPWDSIKTPEDLKAVGYVVLVIFVLGLIATLLEKIAPDVFKF
ncbi:hypothetical protein [Corynebacterium aquatimens]|uniref:SCP domain-containing protein n=1 Tax=Corynebacterium aquatimens TaxID=1190508 RepID=A0A931GSF8_9CORY|nr:hypothetical protein [Corynebacterium aquatimens]MBG6123013.1 hypothetical protein [Corynebacterium aquatimens]WJY66653.1 hypothetical protein CAQUA_09830 [Corynebacterium aquatimens]